MKEDKQQLRSGEQSHSANGWATKLSPSERNNKVQEIARFLAALEGKDEQSLYDLAKRFEDQVMALATNYEDYTLRISKRLRKAKQLCDSKKTLTPNVRVAPRGSATFVPPQEPCGFSGKETSGSSEEGAAAARLQEAKEIMHANEKQMEQFKARAEQLVSLIKPNSHQNNTLEAQVQKVEQYIQYATMALQYFADLRRGYFPTANVLESLKLAIGKIMKTDTLLQKALERASVLAEVREKQMQAVCGESPKMTPQQPQPKPLGSAQTAKQRTMPRCPKSLSLSRSRSGPNVASAEFIHKPRVSSKPNPGRPAVTRVVPFPNSQLPPSKKLKTLKPSSLFKDGWDSRHSSAPPDVATKLKSSTPEKPKKEIEKGDTISMEFALEWASYSGDSDDDSKKKRESKQSPKKAEKKDFQPSIPLPQKSRFRMDFPAPSKDLPKLQVHCHITRSRSQSCSPLFEDMDESHFQFLAAWEGSTGSPIITPKKKDGQPHVVPVVEDIFPDDQEFCLSSSIAPISTLDLKGKMPNSERSSCSTKLKSEITSLPCSQSRTPPSAVIPRSPHISPSNERMEGPDAKLCQTPKASKVFVKKEQFEELDHSWQNYDEAVLGCLTDTPCMQNAFFDDFDAGKDVSPVVNAEPRFKWTEQHFSEKPFSAPDAVQTV